MKDNSPRPLHVCLLGNERSIHIKRWVRGLRDLGHKVDLITFQKDLEDDLGGKSLNVARRLLYFSKIPQLRSLVREIKPDIFHAHYASSYGFLASFVNHPRKIVSVWGDDVIVFPKKNRLNKAIVRRSLQNAHKITATSLYLKKTTLEIIGETAPISVIPFGIDLNFFRFYQRPAADIPLIGIAKWLIPKYGMDVLIRAFGLIRKDGHSARLVIGGRGPSENEYRELARQMKLDDSIEFRGYINPSDMPAFLNSLDICAMPSISDGESFGVAALEAAATGLPVVASRVGGVPEVIADGVTGFLVERNNPRQLADRLIQLISNPALRQKMGLAGRNFVEKNYRWEDNLRAMDGVYREMMN